MRGDRKARSAESRRRAAGYLAQLAWLAGFPDGAGGWQPLAATEPIALDGELIARSRRIARTLLREHGDALPALVGDVERWWRIVDATLAWCSKPARPLDLAAHAPPRLARSARELAARTPSVGAIVDAALIAWAHEPEELAHVLAWIARHPEASALERADALVIARLATIDRRGGDAALALALVDAPHGKQSLDRMRQLDACIGSRRPFVAEPVARSTRLVIPWLRELAASDAREHALALLGVVDLAGALLPWVTWERTHADRVARAAEFSAATYDDEPPARARVRTGLSETLRDAPAVIDLAGVLADVQLIAGDARYRVAATRLLAALPATIAAIPRVRMLVNVARVVARADDDERPVWLWDALAGALARGAPAELLAPWKYVFETGAYASVEDDLIEAQPSRAQVRAVVGALARLASRGALAGYDPNHALGWVMAGLADATLDAAVVGMRGAERDLPPSVARTARTVAEDETSATELCAHAIALLDALVDRRRPYRELAVIEHAVRGEAGWVIRDALARGRAGELVAAANIAALVPRSRWPVLGIAKPAAWIARYPAALQAALRRLAVVDPDAETTAQRRLAKDLPDPVALRREVASLRARDALSERMAIRLANLERRLRAPRLPSAQRLAHLATRLEQTAASLALERFTGAVTAAATERLTRAFDLGSWPGWLLEPRDREILFELLRLPEHDRALAGRLLRARAGPPPWDLRDDDTNRAFLDGMRAHGVEPEPWLDTSSRTYRAPDGKALELALCGDPLEVFAMGAHFQTCLSPDGGNFFSVVANAADINKRVLYARRAGRVVARCLFAITNTHALLTFNVYSHVAGVDALVRVFAIDLAERMHTTIVPRGAVATLLARDWYDDGPRDLVGRFAALDRVDFAPLAPTTVVGALREALGHELDDITLPIVIAHGGMHGRPELVTALAPALLASRHMPPATLRDAACLAMLAGDLALADRLLGDHVDDIPLAHYALHTNAVMLARLRPSTVLARLRATRDRTVRRAEDDSPERNALAAIALAALHRPRQAAALLAQAVRDRPTLRNDLAYYDLDLPGLASD